MTRNDLIEAARLSNFIAFLRAIRLGEGTSDEDGYRRLVGGGEFAAPPWRHPNQRVWLPRYAVYSTAAGAYQFLHRTWAGLVDIYGFEDFSPPNQDQGAIGLIAGRGAFDDVVSGKIVEAIDKCRHEWASLPGSPYGQRTEKMESVLAQYEEHGGTLA